MGNNTDHYNNILAEIKSEGLFKSERTLTTPQSVEVKTKDGNSVLNFCANNYLGLANHPDVIDAAKKAMDNHGFGMASVRFICGTQDLHKELEYSFKFCYSFHYIINESTFHTKHCFKISKEVF